MKRAFLHLCWLASAASSLFVAPGDSLALAIASARLSASRTVVLGAGVHALPAPLLLTAADTGLHLRGEPGAVLDGGVELPPFTARADGVKCPKSADR